MSEERRVVAVVYGGKSTEHEISCRSARFLFEHLHKANYEIAGLAVSKAGKLCAQNVQRILESTGPVELIEDEVADELSQAVLERLRSFTSSQKPSNIQPVIFSIMHGTYGEDGCWQGFWNLADVAFVGCDLAASAVAMDKHLAKQLVEHAGIAVVAYHTFHRNEWKWNSSSILDAIEEKLEGGGYFVKPASLGSSVGISKASDRKSLMAAIDLACRFDQKILVEKEVKVREIELAVLGEQDLQVSVAGEVSSGDEFYSYENKYQNSSCSKVTIPAELNQEQLEEAQKIALSVYKALGLAGLSRVDLFFEPTTARFYFNEANTLPGFTEISQYPLLWQHMGKSPEKLLGELIEHAWTRWQDGRQLDRSI